jgi:hypothetical protein
LDETFLSTSKDFVTIHKALEEMVFDILTLNYAKSLQEPKGGFKDKKKKGEHLKQFLQFTTKSN